MYKIIFRTISALTLMGTLEASATPIYYSTRAEFIASVGASITDDYTSYGYTASTPSVYSDAVMSGVFGETTYKSLSFSNLNLVGDVYINSDGSAYCAGCNGNFQLGFSSTSLTNSGGVFAVGFDINLNKSSDLLPQRPGGVLVEFVDGTTQQVWIPPVGYDYLTGFYIDETYFFGLSDERGISSITVGTEPLSQRHFWVIDNLTIAAEVPLPATLTLFSIGLAGLGWSRRKKV